jgi:hypothetical protein
MDRSQIAYDAFFGKNGLKRVNCAQAFATAFFGLYDIDTNTIRELKKMGVGKAPEGQCGIYFFGQELLSKSGKKEFQKDFENFFYGFAQSLSCKELRKHKIPYCAQCLKDSVAFVDEKLQ